LSSIFIKGVLLIDTKGCIGVDGWHLNLAFLWTLPHIVRITPLVALEIPHVGSFWPWYQLVGHLPVCHSMGHPLDKLELLCEGTCFTWWSLKVEDHLSTHHLAWLIPRVDVIPLERTFYHGTTSWICQ
jgi:hypothetical protein